MRALLASTMLLAALLASGRAAADAPDPTLPPKRVEYPRSSVQPHGDTFSKIIFLNRCVGGCTVTTSSTNNAQTNESFIPEGSPGTSHTISEFAHGDAVWDAVVECVREVYAPFDVEIVTEDPGMVPHHEVISAGLGVQIGRPDANGLGGSIGCEPSNNVISFAFLNAYPAEQVEMMCQVIAQESAHSFGLPDHLYDCTDPMTYLTISSPNGCPRRFFRNKLMPCGEFQNNDPQCRCGGNRVNSHAMLLTVFGPSPTPPTPPTAELTFPAPGATVSTLTVQIAAEHPRGIGKIELYVNGWLWATWEDEPSHLPTFDWPTTYAITAPDSLPDGVLDVEAIVYTDLGASTSVEVQVTKGAACTSADQCAEGQRCEEGKCFWDTPTGALGDTCEFDQQCAGTTGFDGVCVGTTDGDFCSQACYTGVNDTCPEGFVCQGAGEEGYCLAVVEDPGCCSVGGRGAAPVAPILLGGIVGGLLFARRRRR